MTSNSGSDVKTDGFLGGRLQLLQPKTGFRSGIDAVLLAATVPAASGDTILELGCGAGVASACLMARVPGAEVTGVELQPAYAELARRNGLTRVVEADLTNLPPDLRQVRFAHVMMNPPYFLKEHSTVAPDAGRGTARSEQTALADWLEVGSRRLAPRGSLTLIQRADRLADILAGMPDSIGSLVIQPLAPRAGRDANLVVIQGLKGGRAPLRLAAPRVLHDGQHHQDDTDDYAEWASDVLRNGGHLPVRD